MIRTERIDGDALDYRSTRSTLPCPTCDEMPVAVMFDYDVMSPDADPDTVLTLDDRAFTTCWVKSNLIYIHLDSRSTDELDGCGLRCPTCGFEPESSDELESTGKGVHADQTTYVCPECDGEDWGQGWHIAWRDRYG